MRQVKINRQMRSKVGSRITKECCLIRKSQLCAIARLLDCRLSSHWLAANRRLNRICARPVIGHNKYLKCLAWFKRCKILTKFNYF